MLLDSFQHSLELIILYYLPNVAFNLFSTNLASLTFLAFSDLLFQVNLIKATKYSLGISWHIMEAFI